MPLPPPIRGFRSKVINALLREVRAITPLQGDGVRVRRTPGGTIIDAEPGVEGIIDPAPVAWTVREGEPKEEDSGGEGGEGEDGGEGEPKQTWEVFCPIVALPGREVCPVGMLATGWHAVPEEVAKDTLWAIYTPPPKKTEEDGSGGSSSGGSSSGEGESVILANAPDPNKLSVRIGEFELDTGSNKRTWTQIHAGVIVVAGEGGVAATVHALGPIEEAEGEYGEKRFVQFAGAWAYDKDAGRWTFSRAADELGNELPPALEFPAREALFRGEVQSGSSSTSHGVFVKPSPDFLPGAEPIRWLGLHTADVFKGVTYTPPANETGEGSLDGQGQTFTYLGTEPTGTGEVNFLKTIVEDANNITTYQDAPDGGEGGE